jgi:hypothetical protein
MLKSGRITVDTNGDDDIGEGDYLILSSTTTGVCDSLATPYTGTSQVGSYEPFGVALAADSDTDNTVDAEIFPHG